MAVAVSLESVESRRLSAAAASWAVNFQPMSTRRVPGMLVDYGSAYGVRRGGLSYGWSTDATAGAVRRNVAPSRRNDTFVTLPAGSHCELSVPDGTYRVYVVAGDPAKTGDRMALTVEGDTAVAGVTRRRKPYLEGDVTVTVSDGTLTLASAGAFGADKVNYLAVQAVDSGGATPAVPNVPVTSKINWTPAAPMTVRRTEAESAVVGGKLYVFSGYGDQSTGDNGWQPAMSFEVYDPKTGHWTNMGNMPIGTTHAGVAVVGTDVWMAGGYTTRLGTVQSQDITNTTVRIYHTTANTWSLGPSLPQKRGSGGLALVGHTLYFVSGEPVDHVSDMKDVWALDLNDQAAGWVAKAPIPQGRTHFGIAVVGTKIFVIGGQTNIDANATFLKTAYAYDTRTNKWTRLADLPSERSHLSPNTMAIDGKIYSFGGEHLYNHELAEVIRYDPDTNRFTELTALPAARGAGAAGLIDGQLIFAGGKNNAFFGNTWMGTFV